MLHRPAFLLISLPKLLRLYSFDLSTENLLKTHQKCSDCISFFILWENPSNNISIHRFCSKIKVYTFWILWITCKEADNRITWNHNKFHTPIFQTGRWNVYFKRKKNHKKEETSVNQCSTMQNSWWNNWNVQEHRIFQSVTVW